METIIKSSQVSEADLALINGLTLSPVTAEEVFAFALRLCDNEIDRDSERFDRPALDKLAELFVGKPGIFDHRWTAQGQTARLYKTEVVEVTGQATAAGDTLCYLKGWAYMPRTEANESLIREIETGIKREVSVGVSMGQCLCSICGGQRGRCGHRAGMDYDGKTCHFILSDPQDAYEWSFVAVPAQRDAGVIKGMGFTGQSEAALDRWADLVAARLAAKSTPQRADDQVIALAWARMEMEKIRFGGDNHG